MELLRDRGEEIRARGVQPFGISRDSPWTHVAWTQALDLDFPLLSDWNGEAARAFGVAFEFRGMRDVAGRSAFLIGRDGVAEAAWHYETGELPDLDAIVAALPPSA
jgi:peroxiredoxin